jgi:hypothetical protein
MKLIRIEHDESGDGFFTARDENFNTYLNRHPLMISAAIRHDDFPTPQEEGIGYVFNSFEYIGEWKHGYKTIDQMMEWIYDSELKEIIKWFKIYLIECEEYVLGEHQILFNDSSIISKDDISSLFE